MLLTREVAQIIQRAEVAGIRSGIATVRRLYPDVCAESIDVAGGLVAFTGVDSPLSQAIGVGTDAAIANGDIARITEFYASRDATPRVLVTPLADPALGRGLAAAGYVPVEYENVLAASDRDARAERDERIGVATDLHAWARASAQAFMDVETLAPGDDVIAIILASSDGVVPLELRENGAIVATAAMDLCGGCAALFAGSTIAARRKLGLHTAMIRDRLARARDAGATMLRATARPGSSSERNFLRCGFATLYTRALWECRRSSPSPA